MMGETAAGATSSPSSVPAWLEPQLATLTRARFSDPAWIFERKLDGERCIAYGDGKSLRLMSRNRHDISSRYPELSEALVAQFRPGGDIVDGEIVAFVGDQTSFEQLQQRIGVAQPAASLIRAVPVFYYVFDVLYAEGHDVRSRPQAERKDLLRTVLTFEDPIRYTEHRERDGERFYAQACADRWEGLIAKRAAAPYRGGRSPDWLKFKCENEQEFVIGGYTDPQGSRQGLGALLLGYYEPDGTLAYAGKVGTGFSDNVLAELHAALCRLERHQPAFGLGTLPRRNVHWVEPRMVAQVGFSEWTTDGQLRHPRYLGLRDDKDPAEVIREIGT
jgi:bifunctional non-homologous end joining protein LigD